MKTDLLPAKKSRENFIGRKKSGEYFSGRKKNFRKIFLKNPGTPHTHKTKTTRQDPLELKHFLRLNTGEIS